MTDIKECQILPFFIKLCVFGNTEIIRLLGAARPGKFVHLGNIDFSYVNNVCNPFIYTFLRRGAFSKRMCPSVCNSVCHTYFSYGKTLPLFLSDIFLLSETISVGFFQTWTWYFHIFIPLSDIFSQMINDLQWSMVFNDHSILLYRDYY